MTIESIVDFYRDKTTKKPQFQGTIDPAKFTLTNTPMGIGDCVMMTDLPRAAATAGKEATTWLCSPHFRTMVEFNRFHRDMQHPFWVSLSAMVGAFDIGPGHNIQRARRVFGLPVDPWPSGYLDVPGAQQRMKVSLHFEAGSHATHQREVYHHRARQVYPENLNIIRQFIKSHPELEFFEVGGTVLRDTVPNMHGQSLRDVIIAMSKCCLHIGIISGPYHIANALGLRTICIINFPDPWQLMLPTLVPIDVVEAEWLYPQSHILHQDHDSLHWPKFSAYSLDAAFNAETYPYTDQREFLNLVSK